MPLPAIFDPFAKGAAPAVMTRIALDWMIEADSINPILDDVAQEQYSREFLLGHFVEVMADVACGFRPSPRAAFLKRQFDHIASISAFYRKLGRMELAVSEALVRQAADRASELIAAAGALGLEPIPGFAARILDGNVMTGTDHRPAVTRSTRAAVLPGMSLAIYEPASGLVREVVLAEDAHTQERALLDRVPVQADQLWIMDRNFCVRTFLGRIQDAGAFFLVRRHRWTLPFEPIEPPRSLGRTDAGELFEQTIRVAEAQSEGRSHELRRILLRLDQPTRNDATEIELVTNLPACVPADRCCEAYRGRWEIEGHFQRLTDLLHCEVPGLGYPRAALFAFCMSAVAGNALAILKGNLRAAHGVAMEAEVSDYALVHEIAEVYPGMMIALPRERWRFVGSGSVAEVAGLLNELAAGVPVERMLRSRRGPKKPPPARSSGRGDPHVATKKLLDKARGVPPPTKTKRSKAKG